MAMLALQSPPRLNSRSVGLAATVVLHGLLLVAVLSYTPVRKSIHNAAPIMVSLIDAPAIVQPADPPRPLPMHNASAPRPPRVEPFPSPAVSPPTPAATESAVPEVSMSPPDAPPAPAPTAPLPVVPPSFNAAYLDNPAPAYPPLARRSGEQGRVVLRVLVTASGAADAVELRTSSGSPRLDQAAMDTVRHWRFLPARQGDQAVAAWVLVPITFSLER